MTRQVVTHTYIVLMRYKVYKIGKKIKETETEDGNNDTLCTLNNNIVMIVFEKSLHNI